MPRPHCRPFLMLRWGAKTTLNPGNLWTSLLCPWHHYILAPAKVAHDLRHLRLGAMWMWEDPLFKNLPFQPFFDKKVELTGPPRSPQHRQHHQQHPQHPTHCRQAHAHPSKFRMSVVHEAPLIMSLASQVHQLSVNEHMLIRASFG